MCNEYTVQNKKEVGWNQDSGNNHGYIYDHWSGRISILSLEYYIWL